ncbi:HlyD family efflux transporter periplasmic adaptor subunit [Candidatus Sumerlaeota bacterium]|nr:HlyD family efflux transporter periplasmic adaptor subunit [Candidatus Sumerlaeota bacterium]
MIRSDDRGHVRMMSRVDGVAGRGRRSWLFWLAAAALVCAVAASWGWMGEWLGAHLAGDSSAPELDRLFTVRKGGFKIEIEREGEFCEVDRYNLIFRSRQQQGDLRITKVVEDKTPVKKGDVVIEISRDSHDKRLDQLKQDLETAQKDLALSREELEIKKSGNMSSIKNSAHDLENARESMAQYRDMESRQRKKTLRNAIDEAVEDYDAAVAKLKEARDNKNSVQAGGMESEELEQLERQVNEAQQQLEQRRTSLENAQYQLRIFRQYQHPQKMDSLQEAVDRAKLVLDRTIVQAKGSVVQEESMMRNLQNSIAQTEQKIKEISEDLDNLTLRAPADGIVSLGAPESINYGGYIPVPQVGINVYSGQILATIPVLSKMIVKTRIPETHRSKIKEGQLALIYVPAVDNLEMSGSIEMVSQMTEKLNPWEGGDEGVKYYPIEIGVENVDPRITPGLTAKVEIIIDEVQDALYLPFECVYLDGDQAWCDVWINKQIVPRKIEAGRASMHYVEILSGLEEREQVLLNPGK